MKMRSFLLMVGLLLGMLIGLWQPVHSQNLETFEPRVTEFTLDNGLTFIVVKRDVAPVANFFTMVDVGSANEPVGQTGIAHIFEHMAFKGTHTVGTTDYEREIQYINQMDAAYVAWLREYNKLEPDQEKVDNLRTEFENLQERANEFVVNNEFTQIVEREGAVGVNAYTSADATAYFYSLPQNKAELWFSLESDRFINPVMREFYVEKEVIFEERRMRTDSQPFGRLLEEFIATSFSAHPYKNPVIGWPSDIRNTTIQHAWDFYENYYSPSNITMVIVGDVDAGEMERLAYKYFSDMPAGQPAPELTVEEPEQRGERRFVIEERSQPIYIEGYHIVDNQHPDYQALQLMANILSSGRTSRLYRRMVVEEQTALQVGALAGWPGSKYPGLFVTYVVPNQGVDMDDVENAIREEMQKLKDGDLRQEELDRARTNRRANLVRQMTSNSGIAETLAYAHVHGGDWRTVFTDLDRLAEVTVEDIQRVAEIYLKKNTRTVGMIKTVEDDEEVAATR